MALLNSCQYTMHASFTQKHIRRTEKKQFNARACIIVMTMQPAFIARLGSIHSGTDLKSESSLCFVFCHFRELRESEILLQRLFAMSSMNSPATTINLLWSGWLRESPHSLSLTSLALLHAHTLSETTPKSETQPGFCTSAVQRYFFGYQSNWGTYSNTLHCNRALSIAF